MLLGAILSVFSLSCTLPRCQAIQPGLCDTVKITCTSWWPLECDTLRLCIPEARLAWLRIYWQPWRDPRRLLRQESILGLEGRLYAFAVETDSAGDIYVTAVDQAGNESCMSNGIPLNWPVGVEPVPIAGPPEIRYYDVAGRRLRELDGLSLADARRRARSGVLFRQVGQLGARKLVILRSP